REGAAVSAGRAEARHGIAGFIDVETTGLDPATDEIVEFALVQFTFDRDTGTIVRTIGEYVGLRQPSKPIPKEASRIHGITDQDVKGCRLDDGRILRMLGECEFVVAHNARFDFGFVTR